MKHISLIVVACGLLIVACVDTQLPADTSAWSDESADGATDEGATDEGLPELRVCVQLTEEAVLKFPTTIEGESTQEDTWMSNTCPYAIQIELVSPFVESYILDDGQVVKEPAPFSSQELGIPIQLAPGASHQIVVTFAPAKNADSSYNAMAKLLIQAAGMKYTVMLQAMGKTTPRIAPTPVIHAYGPTGELSNAQDDCLPLNTAVQFDATQSYSAYPNVGIEEYVWILQTPQYDEGVGAHLAPAYPTQWVSFDRPGNYLATLSVRDAHGWSDTPASLVIRICYE